MIKIACLGPAGTFSECHLKSVIDLEAIDLLLVSSLSQLLEKLHNRSVDYAWLPWWNSGCGFTLDEMGNEFFAQIADTSFEYRLAIKKTAPLRFSLLGMPGASLSDIKTLFANPYTKLLCKQFFEDHPALNLLVKSSSSKAVKEVATLKDHSIAAAGNLTAAKKYGLSVLQESMLAPHEKADMEFILLGLQGAPDVHPLQAGELIEYAIVHCDDRKTCLSRKSNVLLNRRLVAQHHSSDEPLIKSLGYCHSIHD